MTKENMMDYHIHLHIHELMPGRWIRPKSKTHAKIFSGFLWGVLLSVGIIGAFLLY